MAAQHRHSEEKKQMIYETALTLFKEKGFEQTRISDICQAAGVPVGSVYHFFENKESFLLAYAQRLSSKGHHILDNSTPEEDVAQVLTEYYRYKVCALEEAGINVCRSINDRADSIWMKHGEYNEFSGVHSLTPFLEKRLAAGQLHCRFGAADTAWLLQALFQGCVIYWLQSGGRIPLSRLAEERFLPAVIGALCGQDA